MQDIEGISSRSHSVKVLVWFKYIPSIQVRGPILGGDNIPTLTVTFSRVMRVSTGVDVTTAPSVVQSLVTFECGRGRGRGIDLIL